MCVYQYILKPLGPLNTYRTMTGFLSAKRILLLVVQYLIFGKTVRASSLSQHGQQPLPLPSQHLIAVTQLRPCKRIRYGKFRQATWPWNSDIGQQKWRQITQRWVETATAEKSANTAVKYQQWHGVLLNTQNELQVLNLNKWKGK